MGRMWAQPTFLSTVTFVLLRFLSMTPHKHVSTFVIIRAEAGTQSICGFRPEACGNDELCLIEQLQRTFHQPVTVGSRGMTNCALYSDCGTRSAGFPALSRLLLGALAGKGRAGIDARSEVAVLLRVVATFFVSQMLQINRHLESPRHQSNLQSERRAWEEGYLLQSQEQFGRQISSRERCHHAG